MRRRTVFALSLVLGVASAQTPVDTLAKQLRSADRGVRAKAAREVLEREERLLQASAGSETLIQDAVAEEKHQAFLRKFPEAKCGPYLESALDALAKPDPKDLRSLVLAMAKRIDASDGLPASDDLFVGCGFGFDSSAQNTLDYLATRRPEVYRHLLSDPKVQVRSELIRSLGRAHHPGDYAYFLKFARSENPTLRVAGIDCFAYAIGPGAREMVVAGATSKNKFVRNAAAGALRRWHDREALTLLMKLVEDAELAIAFMATDSLTDFKDPALPPLFLRNLRGSAERMMVAARGLAAHPTPEAVGRLCELINDPEVGEDAITALSHIDHPRARAVVIEAVGDPNRRFRAQIVRVLANLKSPGGDAAIVAALDDPDQYVLLSALEAIAERKPKNVKAILTDLIERRPEYRGAIEATLRTCLSESR